MILSDVTRPANGSYSYGYILMANTFDIKVKKQFTNTMHTWSGGRSGNYCWTKEVTSYSSEAEDWEENTSLVECGDAGGTAGTYTEILDNFDREVYTIDATPVTGGTLSADLITNANGQVVGAIEIADRLFGVQTFTTPVVVTSDSSVFTVSFGVNQASSLWMTDQGSRIDEYEVYAIGSGPFSTFMTVD